MLLVVVADVGTCDCFDDMLGGIFHRSGTRIPLRADSALASRADPFRPENELADKVA